MIASGFCWDKFQKIFKETDKVLVTYLVFLKMSTIFRLFLYYLKHEHECFIRYKMRGAAERFIADKAKIASVLNSLKNYPFYTHLVTLFTKEFSI